MKSITTAALFLLLALHATGLAEVLAPETCERSCPGDGPDGSCPPFCGDCVCCPTLRTFVTSEPLFESPMVYDLRPEASPLRLPSGPEPADIFHVPKPAL